MIPIFGKAGGSGGGGGGGIVLVDHTKLTPAANNGGTTAAITTTGANLICVTVAYLFSLTPTLSDSKGNTYTLARTKFDNINCNVSIYHCLNPIVGASHTFTLTGLASYSTLCVAAFSGVNAGFGVDQISAGGAGGSPTQPGSITPGASGSLVYVGASVNNAAAGTFSIDSGMTISDQVAFNTGVYFGSMGAYLIQTPAAAINPSVSFSGGGAAIAAASMSFRAA